MLSRCAAPLACAVFVACVNESADRAGDSAHGERAAAGATVEVRVSSRSITAPDTIAPGWRTVRVTEDSGSHIAVLFRLPSGSTDSSIAEFLADVDTTSITPAPAIALGGPEIGSVGEVVLHIVPGLYVIACVARNDAGHRHAVDGEAQLVIATGDPVTVKEPASTDSIDMSDFAFLRGETLTAGHHVIRLVNRGAQDHQLRVQRVKDGMTLQQVLAAEDPTTLLTGVAGMARMGPGEVALLPIDLTPGLYVFSCLVADPKTGKPHIELGMFRPVTVE